MGGQKEAQFCLGYCYEHGIGVQQDLTMAFETYSLSADAGNFIAQQTLSRLYAQGIGTAPDAKLGVVWAKIANKTKENSAKKHRAFKSSIEKVYPQTSAPSK